MLRSIGKRLTDPMQLFPGPCSSASRAIAATYYPTAMHLLPAAISKCKDTVRDSRFVPTS
jgi:hypothetical protein